MIDFDRIKFSNLGSYGDVPFELCFRDAKVFAFTGVNGSGKSTLLEALAFVLYGKPWRKVPKAKIVNNKNKRGTRVDLWFSDDTDEYQVTRGIKPDLFEIRRNGTLVNQDAKSRDYQKVLEEEILKLSWDAFNQVVIIGKATYVPFMQLDAAKRRSFVESVLGLRVFTDMRDHHRPDVARAEKEQAAAVAGFNAARPSIDTIKSTLASYDAMKADPNAMSSVDAKAIVDGLRSKLGAAARECREAEERRDSALMEVKDEIRSATAAIEEEVTAAGLKYTWATDAQTAANNDRQAVQDFVNAEIRDAERLEKQASGIDTRTACPTCGGPIDASNAQRHAEELGREASREWRAAESRHTAAKARNANNDDRVVAAQREVDTAKARWDEITGDLRMAGTAVETATRRESELDGLIAAANEKLAAAQTRVTALEADVAQSDKTLQVYSVVSTLLKDTGAKATIIRRYVPVINTIVNDLLADMGFFARFELNDEFDDKILSQGFEEMSYNSYSEGEKLRIDMAVLMAWRELCILTGSSATNLMIFDEILDGSFDAAGLDAFMTAMNEKDNLHLICITHHPDRIDHFVERHLAFAKTDGYSGYTLSTD